MRLLTGYLNHFSIAYIELNRIGEGVHDKDFNFLKRHYMSHAADDIRQKGTTNHMSTPTGEGFQQDVTRHYGLTNGEDAKHQVMMPVPIENA